MNCNEINIPAVLNSTLKSENNNIVERVFLCFNKLYKDSFKRTGKMICRRFSATKFKEDELTDVCFASGLHKFISKIKEDGFIEKGVSVENSFRAYYLMQLKGEIQKSNRERKKMSYVESDAIFEKHQTASEEDNNFEFPDSKKTDEESIIMIALSNLSVQQRTLIISRKLKKMRNEEIAVLTGLQPGSINNEVYKSMEALKKIINNMTSRKN